MKAGDRCYLMTHAYHHVVCEIVEMLGQKYAKVKNVRWIYRCQRGWTDFFRDGAKDDTTFHVFPPGEVSWFDAFEWKHAIPGGED
jgi:hypothetical protein